MVLTLTASLLLSTWAMPAQAPKDNPFDRGRVVRDKKGSAHTNMSPSLERRIRESARGQLRNQRAPWILSINGALTKARRLTRKLEYAQAAEHLHRTIEEVRPKIPSDSDWRWQELLDEHTACLALAKTKAAAAQVPSEFIVALKNRPPVEVNAGYAHVRKLRPDLFDAPLPCFRPFVSILDDAGEIERVQLKEELFKSATAGGLCFTGDPTAPVAYINLSIKELDTHGTTLAGTQMRAYRYVVTFESMPRGTIPVVRSVGHTGNGISVSHVSKRAMPAVVEQLVAALSDVGMRNDPAGP